MSDSEVEELMTNINISKIVTIGAIDLGNIQAF
jgi:hypothetical protein